MAEIYVNNVWTDEAAFNADAEKPSGLIWGSTAFNSLSAAVKAADASADTTITVAAGTYTENLDITVSEVGEQKGKLSFVAAEDGVIIAGTVQVGYYERGVGNEDWKSKVAFTGITFDHAESAKHSLNIGAAVGGVDLTDCNIIGDGEYGIGSAAGNNAGASLISNCTFTNAGIQSLGNFSSNAVYDGCTFVDSCINVQGGGLPGLQIINSSFSSTLTDAHKGESFYIIRTNDCPVDLSGCTFNIDSTVTGIAEEQLKWGVLWQRNVGGTKWSVSDIEVNFTDAAMAQSELLFNKNGTTQAANEAGRITISGMTSEHNNLAELLAKSEGILNVFAGEDYYRYDDGNQVLNYDLSTIYVNNAWNSDFGADLGDGKCFGINAFASVDSVGYIPNEATLKIVEGASVSSADYTFMNTDPGDDYRYYDILTEETNYNAVVDGTWKNGQIVWNNADFAISETGFVHVSETFRVMGGNLSITGTRADGEDIPADLAPGHWGANFVAKGASLQTGYLMTALGNTAVVKDACIVITAGMFNVGWELVPGTAASNSFTLDNTYVLVGNMGDGTPSDLLVNKGSELILDNGSVIRWADVAGLSSKDLDVSVDADSSISIDASSSLFASDINNAGTIALEFGAVLNFNGILNNTGSITVDMTAADDEVVKLIDYSGNGTVTDYGNVVLSNNADGYQLVVNDNDLFAFNTDMSTIYVNAAWNSDFGADLGDGKYFGINAFNKVESIADKIKTDGGDTTVKIVGDQSVSETLEFKYGTGNITFTADSAVTVSQTVLGLDFAFVDGKDITVTVGKNVTFEIYDNASGWYQYYGPSLELYGTITGGQNWGCIYLSNGNHTVHSTGTLSTGRIQLAFNTLTVNGDAESDRTAAHIDTNYLLVEGGVFTANNAIVEAGIIHDSNNGGMRWGASEFYFNGSTLTGNMTIQYADSIVEFHNSDVTLGTFSNAGTVTVTGTSTLDIAELTGNAIQLESGILKDSDIGGNVQVTGESKMQGENTFADGAVVKVSGGKLTIDSNASMTGPEHPAGLPKNLGIALIAGNSNEPWMDKPGLTNKGAGVVDVAGELFAGQVHAAVDGTINVLSTGSVIASEMSAGVAKMTGGNAGIINIYGAAQAQLLSANAGGEIHVYKGADVNISVINNEKRKITISAGSLLKVAGGTVNVDIANKTTGGTAAIEVSGTMELTEGATVTVDRILPVESGWTTTAQNNYLKVTSTGKVTATDSAIDVNNLIIEANGELTASGVALSADTVTNNGTVTVTGTSTLDIANLTGNAIQLESGILKDSDVIGADFSVTGESGFSGNNTVSGNIKVTDGGKLTISGTLTGATTFIGAGNDNDYYGIANGDIAAGTVTVAGNVTAQQINANAGGEVTIADNGELTVEIVCVENGGLVDGKAGSFTVESKGKVYTQRFNIFGGATVSVKGYVSSEQAYTSSGLFNVINIYDGGSLTVDGGEISAAQIEHTEGRHSTLSIAAGSAISVINKGILNTGGAIANAGTITVDAGSKISAQDITGDGSIVIEDTGYTGGFVTVIDLNGTASLKDRVVYNGQLELFCGEDGDVILHDADMSTIFVNDDWTAGQCKLGDNVYPGAYYGVNAFGEMDEAAALAASDSRFSVIQGIEGSQVSLHVDVTTANPGGLLVNMGSNGISFDKNGAYTLNGSTDFDTASAVGAEIGWTGNDITIGENVTVNADVLVNTDNALRNIEGVLNVNGVMVRSADKADLIVSGELNVADNFVVINGGDGGKTTVEDDGKLTANSIWNKAESFDFNINGNASVENFSSVGNVNVSGTLDLKKGTSDIASLDAAGTVNVTEGADVTLGDVFVDNTGCVNADNAVLDIDDAFVLGDIVVTDAAFSAASLTEYGCYIFKLKEQLEVDSVTLVFFEKDAVDNGRSFEVAVERGDDCFRFINDTILNGDYDVTVMAGGKAVEVEIFADKGSLDVYGESSVNITELSGEVFIRENAVLRKSEIKSGTVAVTGNADMAGNENYLRNLYVAGTNADGSAATVTVDENSTLKSTITSIGGTSGDSDFDRYFGSYYKDAAGAMDIAGTFNTEALALYRNAKMTVSGTLNAPEFYLRDAGSMVDVTESGVVTTVYNNVAGTMNVGGTLNIKGANGEHFLDNVLDVSGTLNVNGGTLNSNRGITVSEGGKLNIADGKLLFSDLNGNDSKYSGKLTAKGSVTVTGDSVVKIDNLAGTITVDNADLTDSAINKGTVYFKGENTFAGSLNAATVHVGDYSGKTYSGTVDFGTASDVNITAQMIIGYDSAAAGSNSVVFGSASAATDKEFYAADVSVRKGSVLTIENTTGNNVIKTMNVKGKVIVDNAALSGEVQIGNDSADAEMIVRNGAEVTLGGSSNSVVVLGKDNGGKLTVDNATVTVNRCGAGSSYDGVSADTFVIGFNGGAGVLDISNGADFNALYDVAVSENSSIRVEDASLSVAGTLTNAGDVILAGNSTVKADIAGNLTLADGVVISDDSVITVTGKVNASGDVSMKCNALAKAAEITVAGDLMLRDVELPAAIGNSVTLADGKGSFGGLYINGKEVIDNVLFYVDGNEVDFYTVNYLDDKVTLKSAVYAGMSGAVTSVSQTAGKYEFTVTPEIEGSYGDCTYSVNAYDANGKWIAAADGLTVSVAEENLRTSELFFTVTVTDALGSNFAYTTDAFGAFITDYTGPFFEVAPEAVLANGKIQLSWEAFDAYGIDKYIVTINGTKTVIGAYDKMTFAQLAVSGKNTYSIVAVDNSGFTTEVAGSLYVASPAGSISGNAVTQIIGFDEKRRAVGYIANEGVEAPIWKGIWEWGADSPERAVAVGNFAGSSADHAGLLFYNEETFAFGAWTDITDPSYGYVELGNAGSAVEVKAIGNFDGNGSDDILVEKEDGSIGIMTDVKEYTAITSGNAVELAGAGYFGAENGVDSLVVEQAGEFQLWSSDDIASGNWTATKIMDADNQQLLDITGNWEVAAIGDFKGDGIDDIIMTDEKGFSFILNDGSADSVEWAGQISYDFEVAGVGDYNGDGCEDLLLREMTTGWGGLGYWQNGTVVEERGGWVDLNARIETSDEPGHSGKFSVITVTK